MELLEQIIAAIREFLFGRTVKGERPSEPSFRSTYPQDQISEYDWYTEMNVGLLLDKRFVL